MGLEMLGLLLRHDAVLPANAIQLFIRNTINENIQVRKVCILVIVSQWVIQVVKVCILVIVSQWVIQVVKVRISNC